MVYDNTIAGPAWFAEAVPVRTKMPVPMIAPMPSSVRSRADNVRLSAFPPLSNSPTSCSIDFVLNKFESIHPPVTRPGSAGGIIPQTPRSTGSTAGPVRRRGSAGSAASRPRRVREPRDEGTGARFGIASEQIADDCNARCTGTDDAGDVVERQTANRDNRSPASGRATDELEPTRRVAGLFGGGRVNRSNSDIGRILFDRSVSLTIVVRGEPDDCGLRQEFPHVGDRQVVLADM